MSSEFDESRDLGQLKEEAAASEQSAVEPEQGKSRKRVPFLRLVTLDEPSPDEFMLAEPGPVVPNYSQAADQATSLQFVGYDQYLEGCPVCGCGELEIYTPTVENSEQAEWEAQAVSLDCYRVCAECGLNEDHFGRPLQYQLTGQLLLKELLRLQQLISQPGLVSARQARSVFQIQGLKQLIAFGAQTFAAGAEPQSEIAYPSLVSSYPFPGA